MPLLHTHQRRKQLGVVASCDPALYNDDNNMPCIIIILLAAQHVQQVVFTHRLGQRQASVLAALRYTMTIAA
jgi:hypothetical protein